MGEREMSDQACKECIHKCKQLHGNSPRETISFFKIMFGDNFSKILFLPPKVAKQVKNLVDKEIKLEDMNKEICPVILSIVDGSLAFQKGWNVFSNDHNLKIGDLLVFQSKQPNHFVIEIFDRSGCPKLIFPKNSSNKRKRLNGPQAHTPNSTTLKKRNSGMDETNVISPVQQNTVAASETRFSEEVVYMLNRDAAGHNEDVGQRISLFDIMVFEQQNVSAANEQVKKIATTVGQCSKEFVAAKTLRLIGDNTNNAAIPAIANYSKKLEECNKTPSSSIDTLLALAPAIGNNVGTGEDKNDEVFTGIVPLPVPVSLPVPVKREPEISWRRQEQLPISLMPSEAEGKKIYLRGFDKKLWPVVYTNTDTMGNGWNAFKKANNIGAKDVYVFKLENNSDIYSVCRSRTESK